jgi:EAL domain-containing protein (putative c-di-GMP-specific phosphodiesterase class I)/DICT domain-containing protein
MLSELLGRRRVRMLYQPLVHRSSGDVVGYEALARGPQGHPLEQPEALFAAARQEGRLAELDWLCRATALRGALAAGMRPPTALFVNAEPEVFDAPPPAEHAAVLRSALQDLKVLYEVTERGLSSRPAEMLAEVERARALGCGIAVDNIGLDWHSLALLPFIRPDVVKIDRTLIQGPLTENVRAVAAAVRAYAAQTGAQILAEGIELPAHDTRADLFGAELGEGAKHGPPAPLTFRAANRMRPGARLVIDVRPIELATPAAIALPAGRHAIASKRALVRLSIAIEGRAAEAAEPSVVLGAFQRAEHLLERTTRERFMRLAAGEAFVGAFGVGMPAEPAPGVRGAALDANERLAGEWHTIVVGPHHAEALIARDLGDSGPDDERRFEYVHTLDRDLIVRTARSLMLSIIPARAPETAARRTDDARATSAAGGQR